MGACVATGDGRGIAVPRNRRDCALNRILNIILLVAAAAVASASQHYFLEPHVVADEPMGTSWEGEVISIDHAKASAPGHALVRLSTGDTIRATVPGGCFILPGQTTRIARLGQGDERTYVVIENGR